MRRNLKGPKLICCTFYGKRQYPPTLLNRAMLQDHSFRPKNPFFTPYWVFRCIFAQSSAMKRFGKILMLCVVLLISSSVMAQCSICTKTAQQLGDETGKALNGAIVYLAAAPLLIVGFIGYRWWKQHKSED